MGRSKRKSVDRGDGEQARVRGAARVGRLGRRLLGLLVRLLRLPLDLLLLLVHVFVLNFFKTRLARRIFKRGCQCFAGEDDRPLCSFSYWYGTPALVRLLCRHIDSGQKTITGHCFCKSSTGKTPAFVARSGLTLVLLAGLAYGGMRGGKAVLRPYWHRLRANREFAHDRENLAELMKEGQELFGQGKYDDAAQALRRVIRVDQKNAEALTWLGRCFEGVGNTRDAIRAYKAAVQTNPAQPHAQLRLAWFYFLANQLDKATQSATAALQHAADAGRASAILAACELQRKHYDKARAYLRGALESAPQYPLTRYVQAELLLHDNKVSAAEPLVAGLLDDKDFGVRAGTRLAQIYAHHGDVAKAEAVLKKTAAVATSLDPDIELLGLYLRFGLTGKAVQKLAALRGAAQGNQGACETVARMLLRYGQQDRALAYAIEQLRLYPGSVPLHLTAAEVYGQANLLSEMRKHCEAALAQDARNVAALALLGKSAFRQGRYAEAGERFQAVASALPDNADAFCWLGESLRREGKEKESVAAFKKAGEIAPGKSPAHFGLARTLVEMGRWKEAIPHLEKAIELRPDDTRARALLGTCHLKSGDVEQARRTYRETIEKWPNASAAAMNNLAMLIADHGGDLKEAERYARQTVRLSQNSPRALDTLAWVLFRQGDSETAAKLLASAVEAMPRHAAFRYHYGVLLTARGDRAGARTQLKTVLDLEPQFEKAEDVRKRLEALSGK